MLKEINKEQAIEYLKKDYIKNISLINVMNKTIDKPESIYKLGNSIMYKINMKSYDTVFISSYDKDDIEIFYDKLDREHIVFPSTEKWIKDIISEKRKPEWEEITYRLYLPDEVKLPEIQYDNIRPLKLKDAELVNDKWTYKNDDTINYIREQIENDIGLGIDDENGNLAAWVLLHDDGAMGFLYVLEEHRRKGYAKDLTVALCNKLRNDAKLPFVYIVTENEKSLGLAQSLGFKKDRKICWFGF